MRVLVKICGATTHEAVTAAAAAGSDAVGFVFAASSREILPRRAAELARSLPPRVARVAVFHHPARRLVLEVLERLEPDFIQTDLEDIEGLELPETARVLPVIRDGSSAAGALARFLGRPGPRRPRVLFESASSGSGTAADWSIAAKIAARTRVVLAGGLNPENVAEAIRRVRPYAVDVSSGVESSPGRKEAVRIAAFVRAVREEERRPGNGPKGELR